MTAVRPTVHEYDKSEDFSWNLQKRMPNRFGLLPRGQIRACYKVELKPKFTKIYGEYDKSIEQFKGGYHR